jgi:hypothetical protein
MKISIAIMAHPKRMVEAASLMTELLEYPFCDYRLITDADNSEWKTGKRALQVGIGVGEWHVVIQDDAILTPNFYENIERAITALDQKTLISLYTGTSRPIPGRVSAAVKAMPDGSFLRFMQLMWGVGLVIPSDHIAPMLEFVEDIDLQYDNKIGEFYCRQGLPVYYTVPSLVDHNDDIDSLLPGHGRAINHEARKAHRLAGVLIEWTNKERFI